MKRHDFVDGTILILVDQPHAFNLRAGIPMYMDDAGQLRPMTRMQLARTRALRVWHIVTRGFRPRTVISAIDHSAGRIVLSREVWSWRRWRGERQ